MRLAVNPGILNNLYCDSNHAVYLVRYEEWNVSYVGYASRKLKTHIQEHIRDSSKSDACNPSNVSKHFFHRHNGDLTSF